MSAARSISDDDLCATCQHCEYRPGEMSRCPRAWPHIETEDDYITACDSHVPITNDPTLGSLNRSPRMDRILAYTFDADVHCVDCTKQAAQRMELDHQHPYAMGESHKDDHGIEYDLVDREGNLVRPVFATDKDGFTHCGDCAATLEP